MGIPKLKTYRLSDLKHGMRELGLYGPYLSEMRKAEVYGWISRYLTDDDVSRLQEWIDDTLQSEEDE